MGKIRGVEGGETMTGRKTLFRAEMMSEGYKLGALGMTLPEIASFWDVGERTLKRWCANNPEFSAQIQKGKTEADLIVIQSVLEQAKIGNMTAAIFWLKNRCNWRDNPIVIDNSQHIHLTNLQGENLIAEARRRSIPIPEILERKYSASGKAE